MKNRKVTLEELNALNPCKPAEQFLSPNWNGTILDILNHKDVQDKDKIWAVTKLLSEKEARLFAVRCGRSCLQNAPKDIRPILENALNVAERYAHGNATKEELDTVRSAARSVAYSAAAASSRSAIEQLKAMIQPNTKVRFVKTNVKLGNRALYLKTKVPHE